MDDAKATRWRLDGDDVAAISTALATAYARQTPIAGVCVVDGCGVSVSVRNGHLVVEDGLGRHRRSRRFNRATSDLRRLVILADSGMVTLDALAWCRAIGVAVVGIDAYRGDVTLSTVAASVDDGRLRRQQSLAATNGVAAQITADLLRAKLAGQASVVGEVFADPETAHTLAGLYEALGETEDLDELRQIEATGAAAYFGGWIGRPETVLCFAERDRQRLPAHWQQPFDGRRSPLSGTSARRAATPLNCLVNYCGALAMAECRVAALIAGLDVGIGLLHTDRKSLDSLSYDLVEPLRPEVERFCLDLVGSRVFHRGDFLEQPDGSVRLGPALRADLTTTLPRWAEAAGPVVERVAHVLADASGRPIPKSTPITSQRRRTVAQASSAPRRKPKTPPPAPRLKRVRQPALPLANRCKGCGTDLDHHQRTWCAACWPTQREAAGVSGSAAARAALVDPAVREAKSKAISAGRAAARDARLRALGWRPEDWPERILPGLRQRRVTAAQTQEATGMSIAAAYALLEGRRLPRPYAWTALGRLAGVAPFISVR
jgi:CRISPR-associated protein Cas1